MKRSWIATLLLLVLFVGFFAAAIRIQHIGVTKIKGNPPFYETWQLRGDRSSEMLKVASLRYDQLVADLLWLRAIQSFGGRGMTNRDWKPLYNMFDTITDLDPYFEPAYTFGNLVIGDEGGQQREALKLLRKGTFKIFKGYRVPFEAMYVAQWSLGDTDLARWYGRVASKRLDAPDWIPRMTAYLDVQSGEYYIGFDRFVGNLLRSIDDKQPAMQSIAVSKIFETVNKWNVSLLAEAVEQYRVKNKRLPTRIEEIADMPALQNYEAADVKKLVAATERYSKALGKEGLSLDNFAETPHLQQLIEQVNASAAEQTTATTLSQLQDAIFREALVTRSGLPEDPYGRGYALNLTVLPDPHTLLEDKILPLHRLEEYLKVDLLKNVRNYIEERRKELGRFPQDLREVFYTDFQTTEPFGGRWIYNPETGEFKSSARPEF